MTVLRRTMMILTIAAVVLSLATACNLMGSSGSRETGTLSLSITDAPVDASDIIGVYITIQSIQYKIEGDDGWGTVPDFGDPQTHNLLELTGGESALLGDLTVPTGDYSEIRFILQAPEEGRGAPTNPGSWVDIEGGIEGEYDEGDEALFVPSGAQSGLKVKAEEPFTVTEGEPIAITVDFDLSKALVRAGGRMILKPVLRLVIDAETGEIGGQVTYTGDKELKVYAYEAGTYTESEPDNGENGFDGAVTSTGVRDDGTYTLAFLPAGTYDIVVAEFEIGADGGTYVADSAGIVEEDVVVTAGEPATADLDLTS